jgi:DNA repair exonuclease SbcCD nuclease subunit
MYPNEKDIIFMGDYVYHFSYHRVSLLALLDFFLELATQNKEVYILAGNHDWLGQHFVYTEAEKILSHNNNSNNIHFITKPCIKYIDNETIIFLPYILNWSEYIPKSEWYEFSATLKVCQDSNNTHIKSSYKLNTCIADFISQERLSNSTKQLILIHHYYTADIKFPGIKTQFGYKDIALSSHRMDDNYLRIISWHIHHSFIYKNYLCVGAIRSTSPLESNILQYLFYYSKGTVSAHQIALNPYLNIAIENNELINDIYLNKYREDLQKKSEKQFNSDRFTISYKYCSLPIERTTITIINNIIWYDTLWDYIEPTLYNTLRETKIKQHLWSIDVIIEDLIDSNQDFSSWWSDRKILLDKYLEQKFWEGKQIYIDTLKELKIHQ